MIRRFAIPVVALLVVLVGCTVLAQPTSSHDEETDPQSIVTEPVEIPDGVVASGPLVAVSGEELGEVRIVKDGYAYRVEVPEHDPLGPREMLTLSDSPFEITECGDANIWQLGFGDEATMEQGLPTNTFPSTDWSFFTSIVVIGFLEPGAAECGQPILATAPLT